ncbi:MAG: hypothetical protein V1753_09865 [Pseudomonadota bacterium]
MIIKSVRRIRRIAITASCLLAIGISSLMVFKPTCITSKIRAIQFERVARRFPPGDIKHKRFNAMARALWQGKKEYTFPHDGPPRPGL